MADEATCPSDDAINFLMRVHGAGRLWDVGRWMEERPHIGL